MAIATGVSSDSSGGKPSERFVGSRGNPISIEDDVESPAAAPSPMTSRKRKASSLTRNEGKHTGSQSEIKRIPPLTPPKKRTLKTAKRDSDDTEEKRLRRFRAHAPSSYHVVAERALTQRLCVLDRQRTGSPQDPEETIEMAGTTGNVYTIKINKVPSCDCPHAKKGNQCKHIIYVLKRTLRAPENLAYQLALLSSEVQQIFANAPPIPSAKGKADAQDASDGETNDPNRRPVEDDCPICCVDFDPRKEEIVWCKAACGNNVHKVCFDKWAKMKRSQGTPVTCPFCRTPWIDEGAPKNIGKDASVGPGGYRNVSSDLGLSGYRDYSTYHQPWVRSRRYRAGGFLEDEDSLADF